MTMRRTLLIAAAAAAVTVFATGPSAAYDYPFCRKAEAGPGDCRYDTYEQCLAAISGTAEAIIDGDLARRVPVRGSDDDLDRLAITINRMLDRIAQLMESLRQVSNDVAHDLRTPLTRLRQRLEMSLGSEAERGAAIEGALADLDAILDTFAALLRIAQIEGGARRAGSPMCRLRLLHF